MALKSTRTAGLGLLAMSIAVFMTASSANAATLNVVGGQLFGASGVIVDGASYDVEFVDETCIDLFSGCVPSEFTFTTSADALLASRALLDQVMLDSVGLGLFDSDPTLTNGCAETDLCGVLTPYGITILGGTIHRSLVEVAYSINVEPGETLQDLVGLWSPFFFQLRSLEPSLGSGGCPLPGCDTGVYAVWTPVPEPGTAVLMGLGLLGLGMRPRGQRQP